MIKMIVKHQLICPVVTCDACGQRIERASEGLVVTRENVAVEFRHKTPACDVPYALRRIGEGWIDIDIFWSQLGHNLKLDIDSVAKRAAKSAWRDTACSTRHTNGIVRLFDEERKIASQG